MIVKTDFGTIRDCSPVRPCSEKRPRPVFWARDLRDVVNRGLRRVACHYHRGALVGVPKNSSFGAVDFGWGDNGDADAVVYEKVGSISLQTLDSIMQITVNFLHGAASHQAFIYTVRINDWDTANKILLAAMHLPQYD